MKQGASFKEPQGLRRRLLVQPAAYDITDMFFANLGIGYRWASKGT